MSTHGDVNDYFAAIPSWPDFTIMNDEVSGRVPVTKVPGWREFSGILEGKLFNRRDEELISGEVEVKR